jgi:hypothetical protein
MKHLSVVEHLGARRILVGSESYHLIEHVRNNEDHKNLDKEGNNPTWKSLELMSFFSESKVNWMTKEIMRS